MKTLTIVRHAKSDWTFDLPDHDRPLNERGKSDVPKVAARLKELNCTPEICFYSTAKRATDTANGLLDVMKIDAQRQESDLLYSFDAMDIINFLKEIDKYKKHIMIVGHNPGLTELINRLSQVRLDNLPTCGFAQLTFDIAYWSDIESVDGELNFLEYPKKLR